MQYYIQKILIHIIAYCSTVSADNLLEFVKEINAELEQIHLVIRKSIQEDHASDSQCFVLVNLFDNDATRFVATITVIFTLMQDKLTLLGRVISKDVQPWVGNLRCSCFLFFLDLGMIYDCVYDMIILLRY